jgi:hypothetical protein
MLPCGGYSATGGSEKIGCIETTGMKRFVSESDQPLLLLNEVLNINSGSKLLKQHWKIAVIMQRKLLFF